MDRIDRLKKIVQELRFAVIDMVYKAGDGHPGPALGITDIVTVLYFDVMRIDPRNPKMGKRDKLVLSKGHACPVVYAALAKKGFFSPDVLPSLRQFGSILQGHPCVLKTPGIDMTSGSLGNGLPITVGMALADRYLKRDNFVYAICGDGELNEGIVWDAAMNARKYRLNNLITFVDFNGWQSGDRVERVSDITPIAEKWMALGWHCLEINGNDVREILQSIQEAQSIKDKPSVIIAKTVKGKGVSFMENNNAWHKGVPSQAQYEQAWTELGGPQ